MQQYRVSGLDFGQVDDGRVNRYRLLLGDHQSSQFRDGPLPLLDQLVQTVPP